MNKDIKTLWVAALRSGDYEQAQGVLKRDGGFCCLGVLCDLHSKQYERKWYNGSYSEYHSECSFQSDLHIIHRNVLQTWPFQLILVTK